MGLVINVVSWCRFCVRLVLGSVVLSVLVLLSVLVVMLFNLLRNWWNLVVVCLLVLFF